MVEKQAPSVHPYIVYMSRLRRLRKKSELDLTLGGAAVYRCDNGLVFTAGFSRRGLTAARKVLFPQPVRKLTSLFRASLLRSSCIASVLITILWAADTIEGMKPFNNRVEGTAVELHGDEDMTLLGIHRSFQQFPKNSTLDVQFYLPKVAATSARVFVEAREIVDTKHYLMQSKPSSWNQDSWNHFTPWPTKDVIDPLGLDSGNIAVLAGYRGSSRSVYLPVDVTAQPSQPAVRPYTFHFETSWDLHSLEKSITSASGHTTILKTDECKISPSCVIYSAASSHAFEVDMSGLSEGIYTVHLVGHIPGRSLKPDLVIYFYHRPK